MKAMAQAIKEQTGTGVRQGTATRRAGKETAARLVAAAHDQLEAETLERFSMRNVAERAGVSLANLQYYFPRREDLLRALYQDLGTRYRAA
jgi:AcrR family transcriptional regulator